MKQTWPILTTFLCCVISEAKLGIVDVLANNHTCCVLETSDPDLTAMKAAVFVYPLSLLSLLTLSLTPALLCRIMPEYLKRYLRRKGEWDRIINVSTDAIAKSI